MSTGPLHSCDVQANRRASFVGALEVNEHTPWIAIECVAVSCDTNEPAVGARAWRVEPQAAVARVHAHFERSDIESTGVE